MCQRNAKYLWVLEQQMYISWSVTSQIAFMGLGWSLFKLYQVPLSTACSPPPWDTMAVCRWNSGTWVLQSHLDSVRVTSGKRPLPPHLVSGCFLRSPVLKASPSGPPFLACVRFGCRVIVFHHCAAVQLTWEIPQIKFMGCFVSTMSFGGGVLFTLVSHFYALLSIPHFLSYILTLHCCM